MRCISILSGILLCFSMLGQAQTNCDTPLQFTDTKTLVCSGQTTRNMVIAPLGAEEYFWTLDGTFIGSDVDPFIDIEWTLEGTYELCVKASCTSGSMSPPSCTTIQTYAVIGVNPDTIFRCSPDTIINGVGPGSYTVNLQTAEGCDSIVTLTIAVYPEGPADLGTIKLCPGDTWELNGTMYADSGDYVVYDDLPYPPYCFQEIRFSIRPLTTADYQLTAVPPKSPKGTGTLTVKSISSGVNPTYIWYGPNGFAAQGSSIQPPVSGQYCVDIIQPFHADPLQSCQFTLCHTINIPLPPDTDKGPTGNDNDGQSGLKPWLYPNPAKGYFCVGAPNVNLEGTTFKLYNRWGALVQDGFFSGGCVDLLPLSSDVYAIIIWFPNGEILKTDIVILE